MKTQLKAALTALVLLAPSALFAGDITIEDAYARAASKAAKAGAAFMVITNSGETDDRLVSVSADVAKKIELHTHIMQDGAMLMREVEGGFVIPAGGSHELKRGGDHVMFMGLNAPFLDGDVLSVTLTFEKAGEMVVEIPVDLKR